MFGIGVSGVWDRSIWCLQSEYLAFGIGYLVFGIGYLVFGIGYLVFDIGVSGF